MSISIIGANGNKLSLITEDKISNKFDDIELEYNLLKDKYLGKCNSIIINKIHYSHFLKQLMNLFNPGEINIDKFINFLNNYNNDINLYNHVKKTIIKFNMLYNLNDIIEHIKKKIFNDNKTSKIKKYDLYKEIKIILKNILKKFPKDEEIKKTSNYIELYLLDLKKEILKIKMIYIKKIKILEYNQSNEKLYSKIFIENVMLNLDNVIVINKIIQKNIIGLDKIINKITNELFILHTLI
jgi:hypothetical protein